MAKGQVRGNREFKKPKQPKPVPVATPVGIASSGARPTPPAKTTKR